MSLTSAAAGELTAELSGIRAITDPAHVAQKSRDYFWYSPILNEELKDKTADIVFVVKTEDEVKRVAAACARRRLPLTVRAGGTGNYGQCVPLRGGVVLDVTGLNRIISIAKGAVTVEAGVRMGALEKAANETGQEMPMWPSTRRIATIGGFIAGGSAGIGSVRHGVLRDDGILTRARIVTVEETPRVIELRGQDIHQVQHAYGTNGIITELDLMLAPLEDWRHVIVLFGSYASTLHFGSAVCAEGLVLQLVSCVDKRFAPYYRALGPRFSGDRHAVFAIVSEGSLGDLRRVAADYGGSVALAMTEAGMEKAGLPPAHECAFNHTTLQVLKADRSWTYLQAAYPQPLDPAMVERQIRRYGDEVYMHHEFAKLHGSFLAFALPLVKWTTKARMDEIIAELEADGCVVYNPHAVTIEEGGMKQIDAAQIEFKRIADPHGLMNPGKTLGWKQDA